MAGFQKISSDPQMVQVFSLIGVGSWFRYLTGTLEILGAIALVIPRLRVLGGSACRPHDRGNHHERPAPCSAAARPR